MKLSEVRPFVDKVVDDLAQGDELHDGERWVPSKAFMRQALAEAFMAGVRSQGLRYWHTTSLGDPGPVPANPADGPELASLPGPPSASVPAERSEESAADPPDDNVFAKPP